MALLILTPHPQSLLPYCGWLRWCPGSQDPGIHALSNPLPLDRWDLNMFLTNRMQQWRWDVTSLMTLRKTVTHLARRPSLPSPRLALRKEAMLGRPP